MLTREELWDKFLKVEQQIFNLKCIIQNPIADNITPEDLSVWRKQCDLTNDRLDDVLQGIYEGVEYEIQANEVRARTQYE